MPPWSDYFPADAQGPWLDTVAHVTHVQAGVNVFADGRLRAGLVYDESILNSERIQVVWLSPNHWAYGYRYGTVRFEFDWKRLVRDRFTYWVEAITKYNPTACRFLITDVNRDHDTSLVRYRPAFDRGPWWWDTATDQHYWNNNYTLEFMIERDLAIAEASTLSFVDHNRQWCSVDNRRCPDGFPVTYASAAARFVATMLGRNLSVPPPLVSEAERETGTMATAVHTLARRLRRLHQVSEANGYITAVQSEAVPLFRAVLSAFGTGRDDDARALAGLFEQAEDLLASYATIVAEIGGITWTE